MSGGLRFAEGSICSARQGGCWAHPDCASPVGSSFLTQHIITLQSLLPRDALGASTMNKFKKPLEEIRDSRSFKGC